MHQPGIEQVQAFANILCLALCCHSNKICAPIAGISYHSPSYIQVRAVL